MLAALVIASLHGMAGHGSPDSEEIDAVANACDSNCTSNNAKHTENTPALTALSNALFLQCRQTDQLVT